MTEIVNDEIEIILENNPVLKHQQHPKTPSITIDVVNVEPEFVWNVLFCLFLKLNKIYFNFVLILTLLLTKIYCVKIVKYFGLKLWFCHAFFGQFSIFIQTPNKNGTIKITRSNECFVWREFNIGYTATTLFVLKVWCL